MALLSFFYVYSVANVRLLIRMLIEVWTVSSGMPQSAMAVNKNANLATIN